MTKYSNNNNPPTPNCFTGILQLFICAGNLPTHHPSTSSHDRILEKPEKSRSFYPNVDNNGTAPEVQAQDNDICPGIIARLMGLDSLPNNNINHENDNNKITTLDSLFRSKSLNSVQFLPDFDPTRATFHRRARTSASFHEQGRSNYNFALVRDDSDNVDRCMKGERKLVSESNNDLNKCRKNRHDNVDGRRNVKGRSKSKKRYEECYYRSRDEFRNNNNNVNIGENNVRNRKLLLKEDELVKKKGKLNGKVVTSKKKVDHKEDMFIEVQIDDQLPLPSRSPCSVLDDYYKEFEFVTLSKGERRKATSKSRRKTSPKIKINDNMHQEIMPKSRENHEEYCNRIAIKQEQVKEEVDAADNLVEMLGKICELVDEEHRRDTKWVTNYELWKVHFMEEVCIFLGQELLDLLLDQLLDEIVLMSL